MINCPNPNCNADNSEEAVACRTCSSALPHYYLWGVGETLSTLTPGAMLNNRYLLKRDRIFLDTTPGLVPEAPAEVPNEGLPYLHLSIYPLHVPRLYAAFMVMDSWVLMLESSAFSMVSSTAVPISAEPSLLPRLGEPWLEAPPLRQLSWLWQIAQMWETFRNEQVATTLLTDELVRVEGSIVRLLALTADADQIATQIASGQKRTGKPTLLSLVRSWQPLAAAAHPSVRSFLTELCDRVAQELLSAEQLCEQLELAIAEVALDQEVSYGLAVYTDQGPTRKRNEDACYPESKTYLMPTSEETKVAPQLLVVCDGIGGHQGGDVASKLAIATVRTQLSSLMSSNSADLSSVEITLAIEQAICAANDEISVQNDQAQRQDRDRMGTTLVLALVIGADVYIAHLGDSRAYRISEYNCQQVTLDDDVASRQVRLGGSLYREVLTQPGAGSLVQALGMGPSQMLRPTVQRFVIDENCVFLLCSDGLSDSDRVEQFWLSVLKPLVDGERQADKVGQQLVSLANKYNGHDNVTVGLLAARTLHASERRVSKTLASSLSSKVTAPSEMVVLPQLQSGQPRSGQPQSVQPPTQQSKTQLVASKTPASTSSSPSASSSLEDAQVSTQTASQNNLKKVALIALLLAILGVLAYAILPRLRRTLLPAGFDESTVDTDSADADQSTLPVPDSPIATANFVVGNYLRIRQLDGVGIRSTPAGADATDKSSVSNSVQLLLYPRPAVLDSEAAENIIPGTIPTGGIARVMNKQTTEDQTDWVQLKLCSIPSGTDLSNVPAETDVSDAADSSSTSLLNRPESTELDQPLFVPPGSIGWTLESQLSSFAQPITNLQSAQIGRCG